MVVLVLMLVMSATMVDVSRVNLGKCYGYRRGDLTANTVLTNYDYQLKKCMDYLLHPIIQKDFWIKWKAFYCDTMMAGGIDKDTAATWAKQLEEEVSAVQIYKILRWRKILFKFKCFARQEW